MNKFKISECVPQDLERSLWWGIVLIIVFLGWKIYIYEGLSKGNDKFSKY